MRYVRFRDAAGNVRRGEWTGTAGEEILAREHYGGRLTFGDETFDASEVDVLPPCEPSKIVCIGRNYADHAAERNAEVPDRPMLFLKPPNTVAAHDERITLPAGKERVEHEAELAVVIADRCRNVDAENAMDVVAGFTCLNDISNRDDQDREQNWVRGKAFDQAAPMGPVVAKPERVPEDAHVRLRVNGELRQDGTRDQFIFSIPELVEEITRYMTLVPGDVISTGTPAGVGPLADGDTVEVDVEGVGTLRNEIHAP
ncbi:fumarylacetoacetate hydrolase family protein [Halomarina ordinaria]|uniref:Fumarylacetoacetate hydrolase family protein n=1 Tax=Halomarina ordinaria TaxID=3033939 RepID=A0ABD5U5U8_9EURY|nr:fumarylacetoacetate hydrolase family protein [Halomarina sp. PSRA2]